MAPLGVEDPGLELPPHGVPADPLGAREHGLAPGLHGELAVEEVAAVGPLAGRGDDRVLALVDPVADQPFQLLEALVGGEVVRRPRRGRPTGASWPPCLTYTAVKRVISGPSPAGRRDRRPAYLDGRLRTEEAEGFDPDGDRAPGVVGERGGVLVADRGAALDPVAVLVDDDRRLLSFKWPRGCGIARVERLGELFEKHPDGFLILWPGDGNRSFGLRNGGGWRGLWICRRAFRVSWAFRLDTIAMDATIRISKTFFMRGFPSPRMSSSAPRPSHDE